MMGMTEKHPSRPSEARTGHPEDGVTEERAGCGRIADVEGTSIPPALAKLGRGTRKMG